MYGIQKGLGIESLIFVLNFVSKESSGVQYRTHICLLLILGFIVSFKEIVSYLLQYLIMFHATLL